MDLDNIRYDPEQILNGFTIEVLKELSKRLKRKLRSTKSETIQTILSNPSGRREDRVKVWQEINRTLRKDLEALSDEALTAMFTSGDIPSDERSKVGYMFTLSSNSEIKALGEELYSCRAEEKDKVIHNNVKDTHTDTEIEIEIETVPQIARIIMEKNIEDNDTNEAIEIKLIKKELYKKIKMVEKKFLKANIEGQKAKGLLEKVRIEMVALRLQRVREKEEIGQSKNRVSELEMEMAVKNHQIVLLKQKLEQTMTQKTKAEPCGEINLASFQGRKALIFAERDNEVDIRLNALGIIPIWAMEIDWNRPRRRMSTCQLVLYKQNDEKLNKLDEIRNTARNWNIPCNELLNFSGRIVHD